MRLIYKMRFVLFLLPAILLGACTSVLSGEADLRSDLEEANHCSTASDCVLIGSKCPFDCYIYVNASEADALKSRVDTFETECTYSCIQSFGVACETGKCVPITQDPGVSSSASSDSARIDPYYCESDSDCTPSSCCHPTETVNKEFAPDCSGVACTLSCSGPLDCGCGVPSCENNRCTIKQANNEEMCGSYF